LTFHLAGSNIDAEGGERGVIPPQKMAFTHTFLVPDYYRDFHCKGSSCRRTCCRNWNITLSFTEYFRLVGLSCSKRMRKKLDCAFTASENRDRERYVTVRKDSEGYCPLRLTDGLCGLHKEFGEKVLPSICRYYPRAPRGKYAYECSCTGSCERVLEMLLQRKDKITFEERILSFEMTEPVPSKDSDKKEIYKIIRKITFDVLQDRTKTIKERLDELGILFNKINKTPYSEMKEKIENLRYDDLNDFPSFNELTFIKQKKIADWFLENVESLNEFKDDIEKAYCGENNNYVVAKENFEKLFTEYEIIFENLLINHLFYSGFPFPEGCNNLLEAYSALIGIYAFLRYLIYGYMKEKNSLNDLIDVTGAAFRVIEHSPFYKTLNLILKS